jgi:hypothetical protein
LLTLSSLTSSLLFLFLLFSIFLLKNKLGFGGKKVGAKILFLFNTRKKLLFLQLLFELFKLFKKFSKWSSRRPGKPPSKIFKFLKKSTR